VVLDSSQVNRIQASLTGVATCGTHLLTIRISGAEGLMTDLLLI